MSLREQITKFSAAMLFLLAILLQPIHQLEHIAHGHSHANVQDTEVAFINFHEAHCDLCNFHLAPTLNWKIENLEIPLVLNLLELKQEILHSNFYNSELKAHKQLRAPPIDV